MCAPSDESEIRIMLDILKYSDFIEYMVGEHVTEEEFESWLSVVRQSDCLIGVPDWSIDFL